MQYRVSAPRVAGGRIVLPTSKSISNRLLLMSAVCGNGRVPDALSDSDDTNVMVAALQSDLQHVDVGAAGTSMRFMTAYLATMPGTHVITGSQRMKQRPIALLVDALRSLGADISYTENEGFPPLSIRGGGLHGGRVTLPGNVSSQYISALMMIGPTLPGGLQIALEGKVVSVPYIQMTRGIMKQFGVETTWSGSVIGVPQAPYAYVQTRVEGDWSAASYWYAIAALTPGHAYQLVGLQQQSLQGDSAGADIASRLGVSTRFTADGVEVVADRRPADRLDYDFVNQPDLAQTYVVLCCLLGVPFRFSGLESLKIKETDRLAALEAELKKLGFVISSNNVDSLWWDGQKCAASGQAIATYKDHRMAMAFAPAALLGSDVLIDDPAVVSKSYPAFWTDLASVGFSIAEA